MSTPNDGFKSLLGRLNDGLELLGGVIGYVWLCLDGVDADGRVLIKLNLVEVGD